MSDDLADGADPNCPTCLQRLELRGGDDRPFWFCTSCETPVLSL